MLDQVFELSVPPQVFVCLFVGFWFCLVNETRHSVSDQTIHLRTRAIHLVTQKYLSMERRQGQGYEIVIFNIDREICFTGASKSTFLSFNSQCLSLLVKTASRGFSWQVPRCLAAVPSRKTFILCSKLSS